jgi:hypothetical protein
MSWRPPLKERIDILLGKAKCVQMEEFYHSEIETPPLCYGGGGESVVELREDL